MLTLKQLLENKNLRLEIALDMDGVLCDFNSQFRKYLSNDVLFTNIVTRRKAISNKKLEELGINKEQFVSRAFDIRNSVLKSKSEDVYEEFKQLSKKNLLVSLAWPLIAHGRETFWSTMDWMPGGKELVRFIKNSGLNTFILTAGSTSNSDSCSEGKQQWLQKHGLGNLDFNIVSKGTEKYIYADKDIILIDDMKRNVDLFVEAGGLGIVHTDTPSTIKKLENMLRES